MSRLASGNYRYCKNGTAQNIDEPWSIESTQDGLLIQGERRISEVPVLRVGAHYVDGACSSCTVQWQPAAAIPGSPRHYRMFGKDLHWSDDTQQDHRLSLPAKTLLFPLLRAAAGPLVLALRTQARPVVVPSLHDPEQPTFLHPRISTRHTRQLSENHYRYYGGEYGEHGSDYWLNPQGLLQAYRWESADGLWEVSLDELTLTEGWNGIS